MSAWRWLAEDHFLHCAPIARHDVRVVAIKLAGDTHFGPSSKAWRETDIM